jgi:hypothetical protein
MNGINPVLFIIGSCNEILNRLALTPVPSDNAYCDRIQVEQQVDK